MTFARLLTALALATLAVVPAASAQWISAGQREPDTVSDRNSGLMWQGPDRERDPGLKKIYFNAFPTMGASQTNPNVGALGTHAPVVVAEHWEALLGRWKDCNGDGAIGAAEGALLEYRAELLSDDGICPVMTRADRPGGQVHNDGQVVRELIHLGRTPVCDPMGHHTDGLPWWYCRRENDAVQLAQDVAVWGDAGRPGEVDRPCASVPLAPGTTAGTGPLLAHLDCYLASPGGLLSDPTLDRPFPVHPYRDPRDGDVGLLDRGSERPFLRTGHCEAGEDVFLLPVAYETSVAAPVGVNLEQEVGYARVTLWDDARGREHVHASATREDGAALRAPSASEGPVTDLDGSAADAAEAEYQGAAHCTTYRPDEPFDALSASFALVEGGHDPDARGLKRASDLVFTFSAGYPAATAHGAPYLDRTIGAPGVYIPMGPDQSILLPREARSAPGWFSQRTDPSPQATASRALLEGRAARFHTFYARVDDAYVGTHGLSLPGGGPMIYGAEACDGVFSEGYAENGWNCDPEVWYKDASGWDYAPREADGALRGGLPGSTYHLRDVDCDISPAALAAGTDDPCLG